MDYFLKFESKEQSQNFLIEAKVAKFVEYPEFEQTLFLAEEGYSIDEIGLIYNPTGNTINEEDYSYPEMAPADGWHVNVRGPENTTLDSYNTNPKTPRRVWA